MKAARFPTPIAVACLAVAVWSEGAGAVVRRVERPLLWHRTAVSGYYGAGLPIGEFASSRDGDGNHEDWAPDWAVEIEHFASRTVSIGFSAANTTYTDKTFTDLETHVSTYSGFLRAVVPTASPVRPYFRGGVGGVEVQFQDPIAHVDSEFAWSFQFGGGLLWLPARWLGINLQALYYYGDTEDAYIAEVDQVVGFDCKYWVFGGGLSVFFP
jgi:hypothetical protein